VKMLNGMCSCGAVRYEVEDAFEYALYCHCNRCRRVSSSAFKTIAGLPADKIQIVSGSDNLLRVGDPPASHDLHCRLCGSFIYSWMQHNGFAHVGMGTLLDTPSIKPDHHIFVAFKAPWHEITDDLPQYDALPG
jgi:hypothetical protein